MQKTDFALSQHNCKINAKAIKLT